MKKIIIFVIFMFPFINLNAEEKWSDWQPEKPTGNNLIIEEEVRYKWYKINEESSYEKLENEHNCEYFDKNDFIYSDWITSYDTPEYKEYRTIKSLELNQIRDLELIGTIHFFNIESDKVINITEVEILQNTKKIPYKITDKTDFNIKKFDNLNDGDVENIAVDFENYDKISMTFDNLILNNNLILKITFKNDDITIKKIGLATGHDMYNYLTIQNIYEDIFTMSCNDTTCDLNIKMSNLNYNTFPEMPIIIYQYQDKLYKCKNTTTEYIDGYYTNIDNYIKDESTEKTFYRYKTKEHNILNEVNDIVYEKRTNTTTREDTKDINNSPIAYEIENKNKQDDTKVNYDYLYYFIIIIVILFITYLIIKKIVNKNRSK